MPTSATSRTGVLRAVATSLLSACATRFPQQSWSRCRPRHRRGRSVAEAWQKRLAEVARGHSGKLPPEEWAAWHDFQQVQMRKLELVLDEGRGECLLRLPENQQLLVEALHHFEGTRCEMLAYAIMPNHAHVICRPLGTHTLESLTRSWKRHSGDRIHRRLGRAGSLWQEESFDRIIRDAAHYRQAVGYIAKNPLKARLQSPEAVVWLHPRIAAVNAPPPAVT
jgi:putative transposase